MKGRQARKHLPPKVRAQLPGPQRELLTVLRAPGWGGVERGLGIQSRRGAMGGCNKESTENLGIREVRTLTVLGLSRHMQKLLEAGVLS